MSENGMIENLHLWEDQADNLFTKLNEFTIFK